MYFSVADIQTNEMTCIICFLMLWTLICTEFIQWLSKIPAGYFICTKQCLSQLSYLRHRSTVIIQKFLVRKAVKYNGLCVLT